MAQKVPQTFQNHARLLPPFHFVVLPLLLIYFCRALYQVVAQLSVATVFDLGLAVALMFLALTTRQMAMTVQDRVIRLEERLRMRALLPADLQPRIDEFTVDQLISLRFASDEELPAVARTVLDEHIEDRKAIKQKVTRWRADHLRA
jgi:hypothetical protein